MDINLPDNIVQAIVADIMDMPRLGTIWNEMDLNSRYLTMDNWRRIVRDEIREAINEVISES